MKKCVKSKISNNRGETLAETLISLLISSLGLVMLASAINFTSGIIKKGQTKMVDLYNANNAMIEGTDNASLHTAGPVSMELTDEFGVTSFENYQVTYRWHDLFNNKKIIMYQKY